MNKQEVKRCLDHLLVKWGAGVEGAQSEFLKIANYYFKIYDLKEYKEKGSKILEIAQQEGWAGGLNAMD